MQIIPMQYESKSRLGKKDIEFCILEFSKRYFQELSIYTDLISHTSDKIVIEHSNQIVYQIQIIKLPYEEQDVYKFKILVTVGNDTLVEILLQVQCIGEELIVYYNLNSYALNTSTSGSSPFRLNGSINQGLTILYDTFARFITPSLDYYFI